MDDCEAFQNLALMEIEIVWNKVDENPEADDYPFTDYHYEHARDLEGGLVCPHEGNNKNKTVCETFSLQRKQVHIKTMNHSSKRVLW